MLKVQHEGQGKPSRIFLKVYPFSTLRTVLIVPFSFLVPFINYSLKSKALLISEDFDHEYQKELHIYKAGIPQEKKTVANYGQTS